MAMLPTPRRAARLVNAFTASGGIVAEPAAKAMVTGAPGTTGAGGVTTGGVGGGGVGTVARTPPMEGICGGVRATVPTPPPPTPPVVTPPAPVVPGAPVTIAFAAGSATMPPEAVKALTSLAARRGVGSIAITGYGEATSSDP